MRVVQLSNAGYWEFLKGKLTFRKGMFEGEGYGFVKVKHKEDFLGYGYLNFRDRYPLRIYSVEMESFEEALRENIRRAKNYREKRLGYKDVYRLVYSDADWLPGLIVDRYNEIFVIYYNSFLYSKNRNLIKEVLVEEFGKEISVYDKSRENFLHGEKKETVIKEGKVKFIVSVEGQKTGFYLDQRENRILLYNFLSGDETVLDTFSYSGGFGIHALKKGCEVTFLEKNAGAISLLRKNLELNKLEGRIVKKDFFRFETKEKFDVVLVDPPNYSEYMSREMAFRNYYKIARKALELSKGLLIYSLCDPNVDHYQLMSLVQKAGKEIGKNPKAFKITFQSPDHPVTYPGLLYLKTVWFYL